MAVYAITGKLGSGKGKASIDQIRRYLRAGKRVATNCDIFLEHLMPSQSRSSVIRIPDKPSGVDLYMIGSGNKFIEFDPILIDGKDGFEAKAPAPKLLPGFDESHNGALVLDECGSWLNTRTYQDKGRAELLEWAIHARKYGWDIFFQMQNISQVDKQLRDSLLEYVVRLNRLDRMKVPFVSGALKALTFGAVDGNLPRMHIGVVRLGASPDALVADRWVFRGDDLNNAYNTTQVFSDSYSHGPHCLLSAWHLSARVGVPSDFVGPVRPGSDDDQLIAARALPPKKPKHMKKIVALSLVCGVGLGAVCAKVLAPKPVAMLAEKDRVYTDKFKVLGHMQRGKGAMFLQLSDGRIVQPKTVLIKVGGAFDAEIEAGVWVRGTM